MRKKKKKMLTGDAQQKTAAQEHCLALAGLRQGAKTKRRKESVACEMCRTYTCHTNTCFWRMFQSFYSHAK